MSLLALVLAATAVQEPQSQLKLSVPEEAPCVYLPASALNLECPANPRPNAKQEGNWLYAQSKDESLGIVGTVVEVEGISGMSPAEIDTFITTFADSLHFKPETMGDHLHSIRDLEGLRVAGFRLHSDDVKLAGYMVPVGDQLVTMIVFDQNGRESKVADALVASVQIPGIARFQSAGFGVQHGHSRSKIPLGWIVVPILGVAAYLITRLQESFRSKSK